MDRLDKIRQEPRERADVFNARVVKEHTRVGHPWTSDVLVFRFIDKFDECLRSTMNRYRREEPGRIPSRTPISGGRQRRQPTGNLQVDETRQSHEEPRWGSQLDGCLPA